MYNTFILAIEYNHKYFFNTFIHILRVYTRYITTRKINYIYIIYKDIKIKSKIDIHIDRKKYNKYTFYMFNKIEYLRGVFKK